MRWRPRGERPGVPGPGTAGGARRADRPAAVSSGHRRPGAGEAREAPQGRQAGPQSGGAATRAGRRPARGPERGVQARRGRVVSSAGTASVRLRERPLGEPGEEAVTGRRGEDAAVAGRDRRARVWAAGTRRRARHQVRRHPGAPGSDGMSVDGLGASWTTHGPPLRAAWRAGSDGPQPVRRTAIPKAGGGTRHVGLPPGLDRCSEPALWPVVPEAWDPTCAARSDGVRPPHSADHAVGPAQVESRAGDAGVGDMALARCCDQGNHDVLEAGTPTGDGAAGAHLEPPVREAGVDPGGARGAHGGGDPARGPPPSGPTERPAPR